MPMSGMRYNVRKNAKHIETVRANYPVVDQDLLYIVFENKIRTLDNKYN